MSRTRLRALIASVFSLVAFLVAPLRAEDSLEARYREVLDGWLARVTRADELLRDKDFVAAEEAAQELLDEFAQRLAGGPHAADFYAVVLVRRSLARLGRGQGAEAEWDWSVARAFRSDLPSFESVAGLPLPEATEPADGSGIRPPEILERTPPRYPKAAIAARNRGTVELTLVVTTAGLPRTPAIATSVTPTLDFAALEAIRLWRFAPATRDGRPIAVRHRLTVKFDITFPNAGRESLIEPRYPPGAQYFPRSPP